MLNPLAPPRRSGAERTVELSAAAPRPALHKNELMTSPDQPKRRLGRPPLAEELRRTSAVNVALTRTEHDALKAAAARTGERVAVAARHALLRWAAETGAGPGRSAPAAASPPTDGDAAKRVLELTATVTQLAAIGRNLNQVVRAMNAGRILGLRRSTVRAAVQRVEEVDAAVRRVERAIVEEMAQWS